MEYKPKPEISNGAGWAVGVGGPVTAAGAGYAVGGTPGAIVAGVSMAVVQHLLPLGEAVYKYIDGRDTDGLGKVTSAIVGAQRETARFIDRICGTTPEGPSL